MGESTEKVYCGNCKHYTSGVSDRFYEYCKAEDDNEEVTINNYYRPQQSKLRNGPSELNKYNNCRWYEKRG